MFTLEGRRYKLNKIQKTHFAKTGDATDISYVYLIYSKGFLRYVGSSIYPISRYAAHRSGRFKNDDSSNMVIYCVCSIQESRQIEKALIERYTDCQLINIDFNPNPKRNPGVNPSGRPMKFPGGSRPKTFRLPRLFYDEAVKGVEEYLKKYELKTEYDKSE